jgi:nitrogen-specific signal transduction histidine kinase
LKQLPAAFSRCTTKGRRRKAPISAKALLHCLDISLTPIVVLDKEGRAVYCNESFQIFCASALAVAGTEGAPAVTRWPEDSNLVSSASKVGAPATHCSPEVQAWLDSGALTREPDLRISRQPFTIDGVELTVLWIIDSSQGKRTRLLDEAFLHDIVNAAGSVQMSIDLLLEGHSRRERAEYLDLLQVSMNRLLSGINREKMVLDNSGPLPAMSSVLEALKSLAEYYRSNPLGRNRRIELDEDSIGSLSMLRDQSLLVRVLDNMLRSALEATSEGGIVTVSCHQIEGELELRVQAANAKRENVPREISNLSSSNKGNANIGAQAVSLLSGSYGKTGVLSSDQGEITFSVRYPAASENLSQRKRYHAKHAS